MCVVAVRCLIVLYCLSFDDDVWLLLFVGLPMVGVWCNWRVLLCLMAVRAAIVCYMSCVVACVVGCCGLLRFVVMVLCCVLLFGCGCVLLCVVGAVCCLVRFRALLLLVVDMVG